MIGLDSSALVKRYQREEHSVWVREQMSLDPEWWSSALLAAESAFAIARTAPSSEDLVQADAQLSRDLEFFDMVPVDADCLVDAIQIGREFQLRTLDAIHLAAFRAMPVGCRFITFDERMAPAARALGLDLLTPA